jgi:hypothetical protein
MDEPVTEWSINLTHKACIALTKYEDHLRSERSLRASTGLAKAMRELREALPKELLEVVNGKSVQR